MHYYSYFELLCCFCILNIMYKAKDTGTIHASLFLATKSGMPVAMASC